MMIIHTCSCDPNVLWNGQEKTYQGEDSILHTIHVILLTTLYDIIFWWSSYTLVIVTKMYYGMVKHLSIIMFEQGTKQVRVGWARRQHPT
jgi:hypothetical protein